MNFFLVFSWPPKGKKIVGQCIPSWAAPEKDWTTYEIVETLLESRKREETDQVLKFRTKKDFSNEDGKFLANGSILLF